jgi:putative transposase
VARGGDACRAIHRDRRAPRQRAHAAVATIRGRFQGPDVRDVFGLRCQGSISSVPRPDTTSASISLCQAFYYSPFKMTLLTVSPRPTKPRPRRRRGQALLQLEIPLRTWGGKRAGAGRKPLSGRAGVPHRARPDHSRHHPVHVTMRARRGLPSLRRQIVFAELRKDIARASRASFRLVHFSVQSNHVHLLVEANDKVSLARGIAGVSIRLARSVNRVLSRRGHVWTDRYHARALRTPRETRHALVYVLMNFKKHCASAARGIDAMSSASWFDGWKRFPRGPGPMSGAPTEGAPVWRPRTWLARKGWRRHGLIGHDECPRSAHRAGVK